MEAEQERKRKVERGGKRKTVESEGEIFIASWCFHVVTIVSGRKFNYKSELC